MGEVDTLALIVPAMATDGGVDEQPDVPATVWRLRSRDKAERLRVLVDSSPVDPDGYWVLGGGWAFVEKSEGQDAPVETQANLTRSRVEENWEYSWLDYVEGLLVVLPPSSAATQAHPPPRARVKDGRLVLWFTRPEGANNNWRASWQTYSVGSAATLRGIAAELNDAYLSSPLEQQEPRDIAYKLIPSRENPPSDSKGGKLASLWGGVIGSVAFLAAVLALSHGVGKTILTVIAIVTIAVSLGWFAWSAKPSIGSRKSRSAE